MTPANCTARAVEGWRALAIQSQKRENMRLASIRNLATCRKIKTRTTIKAGYIQVNGPELSLDIFCFGDVPKQDCERLSLVILTLLTYFIGTGKKSSKKIPRALFNQPYVIPQQKA